MILFFRKMYLYRTDTSEIRENPHLSFSRFARTYATVCGCQYIPNHFIRREPKI